MKDLQLLSEFGFEQCFKPAHYGEPIFTQLHHFCDASKEGYGTVTYLAAIKPHLGVNSSKYGRANAQDVKERAAAAPCGLSVLDR